MTLYEILQDEVIPLYYARDEKLGFSPNWVALCKRSMASILPAFNNERVLRDYVRSFYVPAAKQGRAAAADGFALARDLAAWKAKSPCGVVRRRAQAPCAAPRARRSSARRCAIEVDVG